MVNREFAIIVTIAAILISIPMVFFAVFQAQGREPPVITCLGRCDDGPPALPIVNTAGSNMISGSNMTSGSNTTTGSIITGSTGNTTGGAHGSSIPTTNPAGAKFSSPCPNFFPERPGGVLVCH